MPTRLLAIEEHWEASGCYSTRGEPCARIRIKGHWLKEAGFHPGGRVQVTPISPGVLEVRLCSPVQLTADDLQVMGRLDAASQNYDQSRRD